MIYKLPLKEPIGQFRKIDVEKNSNLKRRLEEISDFKKRLEWFNQNICSLATYTTNPEVYFEWGNPDQYLKLYCECTDCEKQSDFPKKQSVYLQMRETEVAKLVQILKQKTTYKSKLQALFKRKGFFPGNTLAIYQNDAIINAMAIYNKKPIIDLQPKNKQQRIIYNEFVKANFEQTYKTKSGFSDRYCGFDFQKEKERLNATLNKAIEPKKLLEYCIQQIEAHFNYPKCLEAEKDENQIAKEIQQQLSKSTFLGTNVFAKLLLGIEIDLDGIILDEHELLRYTHLVEIVKFYKVLLEEISKMENPKFEEPYRLNSLTHENSYYENLLSQYADKINTINESKLLSKQEFLTDEIIRVEKEYVQPIEIRLISGGTFLGEFNVTKFKKLAFENLKAGKNWEVDRILENAMLEYKGYKLGSKPNFNKEENDNDNSIMREAVLIQLKEGIGYLMYQRFLKDQLQLEQRLTKSGKKNLKNPDPKTFEEIFYNPEKAEIYLNILRSIDPPVMDAGNNYVGKGKKGIFPLWIKILKNHKPQPIIIPCNDFVYKEILNAKIKGLNLTKDASEFRKVYKRLIDNKVEFDIKALLSQID